MLVHGRSTARRTGAGDGELGEFLFGLMIPFWGTAFGAGMVLFLKNEMSKKLEKALLGFSAGVMIAASVWSLLIPSIDMAEEQGKPAWFPATVGFLGGVLFLLAADGLIKHWHFDNRAEESSAVLGMPEGTNSRKEKSMRESIRRGTMLVFAITLHNIPEGMAVGVVFAEALQKGAGIYFAGAYALALGIAIQNFPEGAIVSMPLKSKGCPKGKAFFYGVLSGVVEPVAALMAIFLTGLVTSCLPYLLSFAAGAMICVVVQELIPQSQEEGYANIGTLGAAAGFVLMMVLDVALG